MREIVGSTFWMQKVGVKIAYKISLAYVLSLGNDLKK